MFPLIVSATLIVLGLIPLARSVRTGAAAAARDLRVPVVAGFLRASTAFWIIGGLLGLAPGPRTAAAYALDGVAWAGFVLAAGLVFAAARRIPEARRRFRQCFLTSLVTAFAVGFVFRYGLLVPLPREGLTVALIDPLYYALRAAL